MSEKHTENLVVGWGTGITGPTCPCLGYEDDDEDLFCGGKGYPYEIISRQNKHKDYKDLSGNYASDCIGVFPLQPNETKEELLLRIKDYCLAANHFDEVVGLLKKWSNHYQGRDLEDATMPMIFAPVDETINLLTRIKEVQGCEQDEWVVAIQKNRKKKEAQDGK